DDGVQVGFLGEGSEAEHVGELAAVFFAACGEAGGVEGGEGARGEGCGVEREVGDEPLVAEAGEGECGMGKGGGRGGDGGGGEGWGSGLGARKAWSRWT